MIVKVGSTFIDATTGKRRKVKYSDVKYDPNNWADATKYLPENFDLVFLKIEDKEKTCIGWSKGRKWDGLKIGSDENILYWKLKDD